jgi:hypothetical protein
VTLGIFLVSEEPKIKTHPMLQQPCECGEIDWRVGEYTNKGGHKTYPYYCGYCGHKSSVIEKKGIVIRKIIATGKHPAVLKSSNDMPTCFVCGAQGAELHHFAPWHIWGEECENWPKEYLCVSHHREWHDRIKQHK